MLTPKPWTPEPMAAGIDYEAQYNNRARVPEHPDLIAGWARDAAAYREAAQARFFSFPYGPGDRQIVDLFNPGPADDAPLVVFIHGGYWQALDRSAFSHMARGLNARGIAVAVPGYDLCPQVRVADIVEQMRRACAHLGRSRRRLVVAGHSAGGHLAACMLATDWTAVEPGLPPRLAAAAYSLSGLFSLAPLLSTSVNRALGLDAAEAERLSPLAWAPPAGLLLDAVVGEAESAEYHRQSRTLVDRWGAAGVTTRYESLPGANHFTVIAPLADPASAMVARLAELARP